MHDKNYADQKAWEAISLSDQKQNYNQGILPDSNGNYRIQVSKSELTGNDPSVSNDLLVFIEVSNTWSGADTYATAELICKTLKDQGFSPISNYTVSMIEKTGQSQLLKLKCQ